MCVCWYKKNARNGDLDVCVYKQKLYTSPVQILTEIIAWISNYTYSFLVKCIDCHMKSGIMDKSQIKKKQSSCCYSINPGLLDLPTFVGNTAHDNLIRHQMWTRPWIEKNPVWLLTRHSQTWLHLSEIWMQHGPLTRYVKLRVVHAPGAVHQELFPRHRLQRKLLVGDHGTCVTHVSWCMSGSLTRGGGENVPGIPGTCATRNFMYLARGPWQA